MKKLFTIALTLLVSGLCFAQKNRASIQYGPWIQNVTETGFTVVFKTNEPTLAYVEVSPEDGSSFYNRQRPSFYETVAGRRLSGTMHKIKVTGLKPGTSYLYRISGRKVIDDSSPYGTTWGPDRNMGKEVHNVKTLDSKASECRFSIVNDIHANYSRFQKLTAPLKPEELDFFVMNGDIVSYVNSLDTMMKYTFGPAKDLLKQVSSIYVRGNHESRGREFYRVPEIFDSPTGEFYFQLRQGPCAFLILDGGEDKPDSSNEYSGTAAYDAYRAQELVWLKKAVKDPQFTSAPWKIVLIHIPTISHITPWYAQQWLCDNVLPVLNDAGVDLMISGHHHKYIYVDPGEKGNKNKFPILVNSNLERVDCSVSAKELSIKISDESGAVTHEHNYHK